MSRLSELEEYEWSTSSWRPIAPWRRHLVPAIASFLVLLLAVIWRETHIRTEITNARVITNESTRTLVNFLEMEIRDHAEALDRMASRHAAASHPVENFWKLDARNYLRTNMEIKALEFINSNLVIDWIEPLKGNESVIGLDLGFEGRRKKALETAQSGRTSYSSFINFVQGGRGFLIYSPIFKEGKFQGIMAGVCDLDLLLSKAPRDLLENYTYRLSNLESDIVIGNGVGTKNSKVYADQSFMVGDQRWEISMAPKMHIFRSWHSKLTDLIFLMNCILGIVTYVGMFQVGRMRRLSHANRLSGEFLQGLSRTSQHITYLFDYQSGVFLYINEFTFKTLGICTVLSRIQDIVHQEERDVQFDFIKRLENPEIEAVEFESRWRSVTGEWRWLHHRLAVVKRDKDGGILTVIGSGYDLNERKERERTIVQSQENLEGIIDSAAIGMALVNLEGRWIRVNEALCSFLGYTSDELLASNFQTLTHPEDLDKDLVLVQAVLDGKLNKYSIEKRYVRKDGEIVWALLSVSLTRGTNGEPLSFISQVHDIHESKLREHAETLEAKRLQLEAVEYKTMAFTDKLTGLSNRRLFDEKLDLAVQSSYNNQIPLCLILIDIDHFKLLNDDFGHTVGDLVLKSVANIFSDCSRDSDTVTRFGGEEFAIICENCRLEQARAYAERLRRLIESENPNGIEVTASFGVACLSPGDSLMNLVGHADSALYSAKGDGRNCVRIANKECEAA